MDIGGKKVLVTGAGGFIGSHLAERLVVRGCEVIAMTHYDSRAGRSCLEFVPKEVLGQMEVRPGDVRDPFMVRQLAKGCDVVFHLAALIGIPYSYAAPASYVDTNLGGTLNVLQACLERGVARVVHTSTSECYGTARYTPIDEEHPLRAQSPYAATKIGADKLAESYFLAFGLPVATVRPFNTFGPRQSARAIVPTILAQLLDGAPQLRLGSLDPVRDLNYVANTVEGFIAAAVSPAAPGQVVNVGSGRGETIGAVAKLAMEVVGREVPIVVDERRVRPAASEVLALVCDNRRARDLLGWEPAIGLRQGLEETARFVQAHAGLFRPEEYAV